MDEKKCPKCGAEIKDETICPACGFNIETDTINNAEAIDELFNGDSEEKLSPEQMQKLAEGEIIDLNSITDEASNPDSVDDIDEELAEDLTIINKDKTAKSLDEAALKAIQEGDLSAATDEHGNVDIDKVLAMDGADNLEMDEYEVDASSAESKKKRFSIPTPVLCVAIAVVALAIGYIANILVSSNALISSETAFAIRSAKAVQSVLSPKTDRLVVLESYVCKRQLITECLIYGSVRSSTAQYQNCWFRVTVENSQPTTINVYLEFDQEYYDYLMSTGAEEDRLKASLMKAYDLEFQQSIDQLLQKSATWVYADSYAVNQSLDEITMRYLTYSPSDNTDSLDSVETSSAVDETLDDVQDLSDDD